MPDWAMQLLVAGGGLTFIAAAIRSAFNAWREDRKAEEKRRHDAHVSLEARVEKLYARVESLLMDAIAREREYNAQNAERIQMDAKQIEVTAANTAALKESAVALARLEPKP